jgi:hypothetical protein
VGIRDFIRYLGEHREKVGRKAGLPEEERRETLDQAEMMAGMAEAAVKALDSVLANRRLNLHEEHAVRFAQDIFLHLRDDEEEVKQKLRDPSN